MNFGTSTHKLRWLFTKEQLAEIRRQTTEASLTAAADRRKKFRTDPGCEGGETVDGIVQAEGDPAYKVTHEDERKLLRFYMGEMVNLCASMKFPTKVKATALMYLKRFFLYSSCINQPPMKMMLTCIYLACKIEEAYIGAEDFCRQLNQDPKAVLSNEVPLLQGLQFDLIVHSPYRALDGLFEDVRICREQGTCAHMDEAVMQAPPEALGRWRASAISAVDALMLSDAPLQHPPGQLALAALRNGLKAHGVRLVKYIEHAARQAKEVLTADGEEVPNDTSDLLTDLLSALDDIDKLGMEGAQKVDKSDAQAIDMKFKAHRVQGDAEASKAVRDGEKEKAEKREAKLKARREQQAAAEARVLGITQPQRGQ